MTLPAPAERRGETQAEQDHNLMDKERQNYKESEPHYEYKSREKW